MQNIFVWCYKVLQPLLIFPFLGIDQLMCALLVHVNNVKHKINGAVMIKSNTFTGAHTASLNAVTIDKNLIIGAFSLVGKVVLNNKIWGGKPAKLIKSINLNHNSR